MLDWPMSSPMMTRILGLRPEGAEVCFGCWACATWMESTVLMAIAVTSDVPASRRLRRLNALSLEGLAVTSAGPSLLASLDIQLSILDKKWNSVCATHSGDAPESGLLVLTCRDLTIPCASQLRTSCESPFGRWRAAKCCVTSAAMISVSTSSLFDRAVE